MIERIKRSAYREMLWKNGLGITFEIARDTKEPPAWRLSIATIAHDGPFSSFFGYDRTIVALDDGGVVLKVDSVLQELALLEPYSFRGESVVSATVSSPPVRDLNVMTLRTQLRHEVAKLVLQPNTSIPVATQERCFVYCPGGDTLVRNTTGMLPAGSEFGACEVFVIRIRPNAPLRS